MKNQKGITLIALVITIIVLLILAGVSIAMLTGQNGLLTKASNAKTETTQKEAEEVVKIAVGTILANKYDPTASASDPKDINAENLIAVIEKDTGETVTVEPEKNGTGESATPTGNLIITYKEKTVKINADGKIQ